MGRKTQFGLNARRTILRCGGAVDRCHEPNESVFMTGTLPGSSSAAMRAIAEWSSYLVHRLKAWINKYAPTTFSMYAWEFQKRGALHLHYVAVIPDPVRRLLILDRFKEEWIRLLENVGEYAGVDMFEHADGSSWQNAKEVTQAHAVQCEKSVAAYLSKYLSKQEDECTSEYYPTRWWGCSRPLLAKLRELTVSVEIDKLGSGRAASIYQDIKSVIDQVSTTVYQYRDRVGCAINLAAYIPKKWLEATWKDVLSHTNNMIRPELQTTETVLPQLRKTLELLQSESRSWKRLEANLSGYSRDMVSRLSIRQSVTMTEISFLIAELRSILSWERGAGKKFPPGDSVDGDDRLSQFEVSGLYEDPTPDIDPAEYDRITSLSPNESSYSTFSDDDLGYGDEEP